MTNSRTDYYKTRLADLGPGQETVGVTTSSGDPSGQVPTPAYHNKSTVNQAAYGAQSNDLTLGGNLSFDPSSPSEYNKNRIIATASGHSIELDDTPGKRRILIRHRTGNGIEFRSDGSMVVAAGNQTISVTKDQQIVIEGNATIVYGGNVDMQVAGDFNLSVGGSYNVTVGENLSTNVEGAMRTTVDNNVGLTVKGSKSETILGTSTNTVLGDNNTITKGVMRNTSQGNMQLSSGANTQISARDKFFQSAYNMNIAATDLSVFGAGGTIGGENIINYGKSATFSAGVTAPTFHGDLDGTAAQSIITSSQNYGEAVTSGSAFTLTNTATSISALPTGSLLNDYLYNTSVGAVKVQVDIGDYILKSINKSTATGGLANKDLSTAEYRAFLRQEYNLANPVVTGNAVASGKLSAEHTKTTPDEVGRISSQGTKNASSSNPIGPGFVGDGSSNYKAPDFNIVKVYNPSIIIPSTATVTNATKLTEGITVAKFTGSVGQMGNINKFTNTNRLQIARNLQPNAEFLRKYTDKKDRDFKDFRLKVVEGIYNPYSEELQEATWVNSINYYRSKGRAVVYELHNTSGTIAFTQTFDLAVKLKNTNVFQKLIIDHDTFDPSGDLNTQLILVMPNLDSNYKVDDGDFSKKIETRYNGKVMSASDIVELPYR